MKKWFLAVPAVLFLAVFLACTVFFSRFVPDRYRSQVQTCLENYFHQDVELGALSLRWQGLHPTLSAQGFVLKNHSTKQVLFQSKQARAEVRLSGILLHRIIIDRLSFEEAHFSFLHQENGVWNWSFPENKKFKFRFLFLPGWKLRINSFDAPGASVYYADQSQLPFFHQEWRALTVRLTQLDSGSCLLQVFPDGKAGVIRGLELRFVSLQQLIIRGDFGPYGSGEGEMRNPFQEARFSLKLGLQAVDLKAFSLQGKGSLKMEAFGEGIHPESLKRNLIMKGKADIQDGSILGPNLPGEILKTISPLPGFAGLTRQPFRGELAVFSKNSGTEFTALDSDYRLSSGRLFAENFKLEKDHYRIEAGGNLNLTENRLEIKGDCYIKGRFAAELISRARDMDVLLNDREELEIPFSYNGPAGEFKPSADLFYIANRLIQVRGEQLASRGVQKINDFLEGIRK